MATVADASVIIAMLDDLLMDELLRKRLVRREIHAPAHIDAEIFNAIRGLANGGKVTLSRAHEMLKDFAAMDNIVRHAALPFLRRVFELRNSFTAYDALYVALAEYLRMPLLTRDAKYRRAAGYKAEIHVYP